MNDEFSEQIRTELFAASMRADNTDIKAFLEVLAVKLEGSLPEHTKVTRQGSLFSREHPVKEVKILLGEYEYRIGRERQGPLVAVRANVVRGIVLKTEQISVERWIEELSEALARVAAQSAQARVALERFLIQ